MVLHSQPMTRRVFTFMRKQWTLWIGLVLLALATWNFYLFESTTEVRVMVLSGAVGLLAALAGVLYGTASVANILARRQRSRELEERIRERKVT